MCSVFCWNPARCDRRSVHGPVPSRSAWSPQADLNSNSSRCSAPCPSDRNRATYEPPGKCFDIPVTVCTARLGLPMSGLIQRSEPLRGLYQTLTQSLVPERPPPMRPSHQLRMYFARQCDRRDQKLRSCRQALLRTTHGAREAVDACRLKHRRPTSWRFEWRLTNRRSLLHFPRSLLVRWRACGTSKSTARPVTFARGRRRVIQGIESRQ